MAKKKVRYSASQKRAYWIGVGLGIGQNKMNGQRQIKDFEDNATSKELESFRTGSWVPIQNENLFKKKKKR